VRASTLWNVNLGLPNHSGLMLAARITLAHFSVSSAINLPKCRCQEIVAVGNQFEDHLLEILNGSRWREAKLFPSRGVKLPSLSAGCQSFIDVAFGLI